MRLEKIFLWIYCLDFHEALLLLAVFTALFCGAQAKCGGRRFWKPAVWVLLAVWAAAVVTETILRRTPEAGLEPAWRPFQSYLDALQEGGQRELLRSNFMNAVLFYPAGLLAASLLPKRWNPAGKLAAVLTMFAAFSAGIEFVQYRFGLGLAQTDDVIHNALGAVLGAAVLLALSRLSDPNPRQGRRRPSA